MSGFSAECKYAMLTISVIYRSVTFVQSWAADKREKILKNFFAFFCLAPKFVPFFFSNFWILHQHQGCKRERERLSACVCVWVREGERECARAWERGKHMWERNRLKDRVWEWEWVNVAPHVKESEGEWMGQAHVKERECDNCCF